MGFGQKNVYKPYAIYYIVWNRLELLHFRYYIPISAEIQRGFYGQEEFFQIFNQEEKHN